MSRSAVVSPKAQVVGPADAYRRRIVAALVEAKRLQAAYDRLSNLRMAAFVAAAALLVTGTYGPDGPVSALLLLAGFATVGGFLFLLCQHAGVARGLARADALRLLNQESIARVERDWSQLPLPPAPAVVADDPVAADLDLFGPRSLFHLICTAGTPQGRRALAERLLPHLAPLPTAMGENQEKLSRRPRREAMQELAADVDLRQDLQLAGREFAADDTKPQRAAPGEDRFLAWVAGEPFLSPRPALVAATRLLPGVIVPSTLATLGFGGVWVFVLIVAFALRYWLVRQTGRIVQAQLDLVCTKERHLRGYGHLFDRLAGWQPDAPELRALATRLQGAAAAMGALDTLVSLAAIRTTPASPLAQGFFLWDYHTLYTMERWQARHGAQVRGWFEALGETEALASLAGVCFVHPDWPFPAINHEARIEAHGLGHPLLADGVRVANDVTLGPPGTFLLVTGSNMSGKSTLLRTVGMNVVLAQAGAPVCARSMTLPSEVILATSLRVQDSLQEGVSFFMAELHRLAAVVGRADALPTGGTTGPVLLYLLDEILRGTNTQERQVIVAKVVAHLLGRRAVGAVSTHDLTLAELESLQGAAQTVHFREDFEEGPQGATMRFDYRMRPGIATTTNALKLLKVIGLEL